MSLVGPALVDGVIVSSLYGLLAIGVVIIYNTSGVINFAQGALAIFAVFILKTLTDHNVAFGLAALVAILAGALIGVAIDRLTLAPVRHQSPLNKSIITIGWLITLQYAAVLLFNAGVSTNISRICDRCGEQVFSVGGLGCEHAGHRHRARHPGDRRRADGLLQEDLHRDRDARGLAERRSHQARWG